MTKEEAIKQLKGYVRMSVSHFPKDLEALDMAIESLKQVSCDNCESDCEECNAYIKGYNKGFHDGMFGGVND